MRFSEVQLAVYFPIELLIKQMYFADLQRTWKMYWHVKIRKANNFSWMTSEIFDSFKSIAGFCVELSIWFGIESVTLLSPTIKKMTFWSFWIDSVFLFFSFVQSKTHKITFQLIIIIVLMNISSIDILFTNLSAFTKLIDT